MIQIQPRQAILATVMAINLHVAGGCQMLQTIPIVDASGEICKSASGAYFLPKKQILFSIKRDDDTSPYDFSFDGTRSIADRQQSFCLDYLGSAFAEDTVHVSRNFDGLLTIISSVADDKSKQIVENLIEVGVIGATGNPNFSIARSVKIKKQQDTFILADYQIDPFDLEQLAEVNAAMASTYGYCVLIEGHTIHPADIQAYCNNPRGRTTNTGGRTVPLKAPPARVELPPLPSDAAMKGILYRPNLTYEMIVLRRRDPKSRHRWELVQSTKIEMPNVAPVFSIGVERSLFVKRTTRLDFDAGVLKDITIEKPSELLEFMEIPLVLAQALVKVPAELLKVRVASTKNEQLLMDAQRELLATQRAYANTLSQMRATATQSSSSVQRSLPPGNTDGVAGAFRSQPDPAKARAADAACQLLCTGANCTVEMCKVIAAERCEGQELSTCLPPLLPR
jgi:hypothetical protein